MLVSWWTGDLTADEISAVEEHLFACDSCAEAANRLATLAGGLRDVIPPIISHAHRDRLVAGGTRVLHTPVEPDASARARYLPELDLLVHVLRADLSRANRVDVEIVDENGVAHELFEHVPFDPKAGEVLVACQRHYEAMGPGDPIFRVHAIEGGERRRVGDYLVYHEWR
jgi:hypothetical protein